METNPKANPPKILMCPHCGKTTVHEVLHREDYSEGIDETDETMEDHLAGDDRWLAILKCAACNKPSIYHDEWDDEQKQWVVILTYPIPTHAPKEVPAKIRKVFDDAISMLNKSPSLTAVGIRKCLEAICDDKQAQGSTLAERISYLGSNGFIPPVLSDMVHTSQTIANIGSHFGNMAISQDEVNVLIKFMLAIFECSYVAQARIDAVRTSLKPDGSV